MTRPLKVALVAAALTTAGAALVSPLGDEAHACELTIGVVLELTGPAGQYGQAGAKSVETALRDLNEAGGAAGGTLERGDDGFGGVEGAAGGD